MDKRMVVFAVKDSQGTIRFVGANEYKTAKYRASRIGRCAGDTYGRSPLSAWLKECAARKERPTVDLLGEFTVPMTRGRRQIDIEVEKHVAMLPRHVQEGLLNRNALYRSACGDASLLVRGQIKQEGQREGQGQKATDARYGAGVVYGIFHGGRMVYVGTTAWGKKEVIMSLLKVARGAKATPIQAFVRGLSEENRLHELSVRKLSSYMAGGKIAARDDVMLGLDDSTREGLLNQRGKGKNAA